jgi:hypothetical protein
MTDSTPQPPQPSAPGTAAVADFPPQGITAFLRFGAGEWMGLRSRFALGEDTAMAEGDEWHSSERGELVVAYLEPGAAEFPADSPGGLSVGTKGEPARRLLFAANGTFTGFNITPQFSWWRSVLPTNASKTKYPTSCNDTDLRRLPGNHFSMLSTILPK